MPQYQSTNEIQMKTSYRLLICNPLILLVGAVGFELTTLCSQSRCATRLRYAPKTANIPEFLSLHQARLRPINQNGP